MHPLVCMAMLPPLVAASSFMDTAGARSKTRPGHLCGSCLHEGSHSAAGAASRAHSLTRGACAFARAQGRDLRLLEEPPLGGAFLVREDAIIASLDFACIIITTQAAYVVNPAEPPTVRFMAALQQRLAFAAAGGGGGGGGGVPNTWQEREQQLLVRAHAQGARPNAPGQPLATGEPGT